MLIKLRMVVKMLVVLMMMVNAPLYSVVLVATAWMALTVGLFFHVDCVLQRLGGSLEYVGNLK